MWLRRFWVIPGLLFLVFSCVDQQEPAAAYADATTVDTVDHWQSVLDTVLALYEADELSAAMDTALAYLDESVTATWAPTASLGMLWHRLGVFYYLIDDYDEAEPAFRSAIAVREAVLGPETAEVAISYHNLGVVYKEKGNFRAAIPALEQAASIRQSIGENDRLGRTYQELGIVCNSLGDYDQARSFHQAALPLLTEAYGAEHRYTARSYFNLGTLLRKLGRYEEALEALSEAERIYRSLYGEVHAELASCYNNFGNIYDDLGNYPVAMVAYERSLAINLELEGRESMEVAENYNNLGLTCLQQGDLARARQYQEQSLTIRQQQLSTFHPRMANTLHNLAEIFTVEGRLDSALHYEQLALLHKFTNFRDSSRLALPDWETHTVAGSSVELLEILFAKARIWQLRSEQSRQRDDLLAGLATYRSCDQLIDRMRREYTSDESVLFLLDQAVPIYEGALEVVFALQGGAPAEDYTEAAFRFMEKSKSVLLLSSLKENQARMAANMPDSLLQRENELRADLAYRQRQ
ncbi:MAG: tetratricopeptide repeat protein, partial [Lewinella sp.]|nr:tetratricopeptide repeat protein [Lewinella sp.]